MKVAVLGAGVSGLTAARVLHDMGVEVALYEKEDVVGGLAVTRNVNGYLYDPYGGHILSPKIKKINDWVFSILPKDKWQYTERNAKIWFDGRLISYPFELSLSDLDIDDTIKCIRDYLKARQGSEPENFRDWIYWNFGKSISEYYMVPYNEKVWSYPLEDMETHWMRGKMPLPSDDELLRSVLDKEYRERNTAHSSFYYPIDGVQTMVDAIGEPLCVYLNTPIEAIEKNNKKWVINGTEAYDRVISTIPLPVIGKVMSKLPKEVQDAIGGLKFNSLNTVLFDCPNTDITWLYIPSHEYKSHRIHYQSSVTPHACPDQDKHGCAQLEIIGDRIDDPEALVGQKTLPEELGFRHAIASAFSEYAYVIHDRGYSRNTDIIKRFFENEDNFFILGRWGAWNYNNMDLCMQDAMNLIDEHFGSAEK